MAGILPAWGTVSIGDADEETGEEAARKRCLAMSKVGVKSTYDLAVRACAYTGAVLSGDVTGVLLSAPPVSMAP